MAGQFPPGPALTAAPEVVGDEGDWTIQIFSTEEATALATAQAFVDVALLGETHDVQVSTDGVRHFLIVETRDDESLLRSVRVSAESAGPVRLETVHAPFRHRRTVAEAA